MGRKNTRNNQRPQQRRRADGLPTIRRTPPPPIEQMVVPKGRCFHRSRHGKLRFTREEVDKALRQAQRNRAARGSHHVEERYYECEVDRGGCGDFHLTSRTEYTPRGQA